jgi:hypothetical protein
MKVHNFSNLRSTLEQDNSSTKRTSTEIPKQMRIKHSLDIDRGRNSKETENMYYAASNQYDQQSVQSMLNHSMTNLLNLQHNINRDGVKGMSRLEQNHHSSSKNHQNYHEFRTINGDF